MSENTKPAKAAAKAKAKATPPPSAHATTAAAHAPTPGALRRELEAVEHTLAYGPSGFGWSKASKPEKRAELEARAVELRGLLTTKH